MARNNNKQINFDWDHFKCKKCGRCCKGAGFPWEGTSRIYEIAKFLKVTPEEIVTKYIGKIKEKDGKRIIEQYEQTRCPFLYSGNLCLIYKVRPDRCRAYPVDSTFGFCYTDCQGFD